jgi:hypothetical protein
LSALLCFLVFLLRFFSPPPPPRPRLEFAGPSTFEPQHWRQPFVSLKEHLQNATQKETQEGASGRRLIRSGRRASPHHCSNNRPNHTHTPNTPPQPSTEFYATTTEARRPEDPVEQLIAQAEVLAMNTSSQNTMPPPRHQHQTIKTQVDLQQDSKEEIKVVIEDELLRLH